MKILVAGATGVLGRLVTQDLVNAGHCVYATTRSPEKEPAVRAMGATPLVADALHFQQWQIATEQAEPDLVVHLLTDLASGDAVTNARLRTIGTRHLVDCARSVGARVIAESISWIHAPSPEPADESTPLDPSQEEPRRTTLAGAAALESAVLAAGGTVLRCGQLYGPGTWYSTDGRFGVAAREGRLRATNTITSFVAAHDAAAAFTSALEWPAGRVAIVDEAPAPGADWAPVFARAVGGPLPPTETVSDIGRPVSQASALALGWGPKPPVTARRIQRTMNRTFRPGTWRQAVLTFCAVLPMSLLLNFVVTPILAGWPKLALTVLNATLLVATLNWALLPALHYVTAGWAAPRASGSLTRPPLGAVARCMAAQHRRRQSPSSTIDGDDRIAG